MSADDLLAEYLGYAEELRPFVRDTLALLRDAEIAGKRILFEGAQGALLDVDFGTYPYISSSNASAAGVSSGTGVPPKNIGRILGIMKAYCTRVGEGPFPTETRDVVCEHLRERGGEFGATTGRARRCGWLDAVAVRHSITVCGVDSIALTKLDVLTGLDAILVAEKYRYDGVLTDHFPAGDEALRKCEPTYQTFPGWKEDLSKCRKFSDLPANARAYVTALETLLSVRMESVSVGRGRDDTIWRP
jgi:adenylosuccinate synthase